MADEDNQPTGHAHHFLSRLDRLDSGHTELALSLYNDVSPPSRRPQKPHATFRRPLPEACPDPPDP